jgi:hypothetical protein
MTITEIAVAYSEHLQADVVLRTGRTLRIRPVRVNDRGQLHARFFAMCTADQALLYAPADVDVHEFGVGGEVGRATTAYPATSAEFVEDVADGRRLSSWPENASEWS